jgi:hypothetical protein
LGPQFVGLQDILVAIRAGQDDDGRKAVPVHASDSAKHLENLEPVHSRHFQVEKKQVGDVIGVAMFILACGEEVFEGLNAIVDDHELAVHFGVGNDPSKQRLVPWVIFG